MAFPGRGKGVVARHPDFDSFYAAEYGRVRAAVLVACGDPEVASDATQEAFVRAFARWPRLAKQSWRTGWVMTTALYLARKRRGASVERMAKALRPGAVQHEHEAAVERRDLTVALRGLGHRQRAATLLHYMGDLAVSEVATVMGISEGTVKAHLSQARRALRTKLEVEHV
jgi:RNA polymerase sigma-70 factor (ECF subfamily)